MKPKKTQRKPAPVKGRGAKKPEPQGTRRPKRTKARVIRAGYDAALPDIDGDHWLWADAFNANAANSRDVRKTLRERAQYEADNNGYCGGLVDRLANDLVGTGPRPQLRIPGASRDTVRAIELAFLGWARRVGLPQKLRLLDQGAVIRGESFAILATNPALPTSGVQLDLRLYETDQVETPWYDTGDPRQFDGGTLDDFGNVLEWHFLKSHPGSDVWGFSRLEYDAIPAGRVVHWYKPRRAGQIRGVSEILSSLTLYAYLRRYTLATVEAAEVAANLSAVLETENTNSDPTEEPDITTMDRVPFPRGSMLTLPAGWKANPFRPEQPTNSYPAFKGEILTEAGSAVGAPRNVSTNSSAEYNYSSGRLDRGIYEGGIKVRRADFRSRVLDPLFRAWLTEAILVGILPALDIEQIGWDWFYDAFPSVDPAKDATLNDLCLRNGSKTYAEVYAEKGQDWEEAFEQQGREHEMRASLGIPPLTPAPQAPGEPEPPSPASATEAAAVAGQTEAVTVKAYDEDQPRDDEGQFGEGGGGGSSGDKSGEKKTGEPAAKPSDKKPAKKDSAPKKSGKQKAPSAGDKSAATAEPHPTDGKAPAEIKEELRKLSAPAGGRDKNPWKIDPAKATPEHLDTVQTAVAEAQKATGSHTRPTLAQVYDEAKKKSPGLSLPEFQRSLVRLHRDRAIQLGDWTLAMRDMPDAAAKHAFPLDLGTKFYVEPGTPKKYAASAKAVAVQAYSPDQERADDGKFGSGGGGAGESADPKKSSEPATPPAKQADKAPESPKSEPASTGAPESPKTLKEADAWGAQHYGEWAKGLTKDEAWSIDAYQGGGYQIINGELRAGTPLDKMPGKTAQVVTNLDSALAKGATPHDMTTYRGVRGDHADELIKRANAGGEFKDPSYLSTSVQEKQAKGFARNPEYTRAVLVLDVPKGSHGAYLDASSNGGGEAEFLLPRNTTVKLSSATKGADGVWTIRGKVEAGGK